MQLIFLYGLPATGKLTVAKELSKITGYKLFHNHLVVDLLLSVFDFGTPPFVELREDIWLSVFEQAVRSELPGLVFTFNPETTVRPSFVLEAINTITNAGSQIIFIELTCPLAELRSRMDSPSRLGHRKLSSLELFDTLQATGTFDTSHMPKPLISINTSRCTPEEAAQQIAAALATSSGLPVLNERASASTP